MPPEQLFELRRRTFDTPRFRGIEFIEAEAKSILNHVPGNYLPLNWTGGVLGTWRRGHLSVRTLVEG